MAGWHHQIHGHEFEQAPGDGIGQGILVGYSLRDRKESDTTERLQSCTRCRDKRWKDSILSERFCHPKAISDLIYFPSFTSQGFHLKFPAQNISWFHHLRSLHTTSMLNKCSLSFPGLTFNLDSAWNGEVSELHECFKDYRLQDFGGLQMFSV